MPQTPWAYNCVVVRFEAITDYSFIYLFFIIFVKTTETQLLRETKIWWSRNGHIRPNRCVSLHFACQQLSYKTIRNANATHVTVHLYRHRSCFFRGFFAAYLVFRLNFFVGVARSRVVFNSGTILVMFYSQFRPVHRNIYG